MTRKTERTTVKQTKIDINIHMKQVLQSLSKAITKLREQANKSDIRHGVAKNGNTEHEASLF